MRTAFPTLFIRKSELICGPSRAGDPSKSRFQEATKLANLGNSAGQAKSRTQTSNCLWMFTSSSQKGLGVNCE